MFRRSFLIIVLALACVCAAFAQRRGAVNSPSSNGELRLRVVLENESPVRNMLLQVQLVNASGTPVGSSHTDPDGNANFTGLITGASYVIRVSGGEIAETVTQGFSFSRMETTHSEYVHVKMKGSNESRTPADHPTVSMQALNVPDKARKEFEKGNAALQLSDLKAAEKHFRKASEVYPQYVAAENNLSAVCQMMRDYTCVREALGRALQIDPNSGGALLNMGRLKLMDQNYTEAEVMFTRALTTDPVNPEVLTLLAKAEMLLNKIPQAVQYAQKVHAVPHEKFAVSHLIAARGLEFEDRPLEAAKECELFLKEAPQDPEAPRVREALARLNSNAKANAPRQ